MNEYVVHVPVNFNDGTPIPEDTLRDLQRYAVRLFGGLTVGHTGLGFWDDNGTLYSFEPMTRYYVAARDFSDVEPFAQRVCTDCNQVAVYVACTATDVRFVSRSE